jgi:hypothetical protein
MSELLKKLNQAGTTKISRCGVALLKASLDPAEWDQVAVIIDGMRNDRLRATAQGHTAVWLSGVLKEHGHSVSLHTVQRHIRKACACE